MSTDITIPVLLFLIVFGMTLYYFLLRLFVRDWFPEERKRRRKKESVRRRCLDTPPCSKCIRGFLFYGKWHCNCNEYKEQVERLTTNRPEYVSASDIRGTEWCRYEPGLEDGEGI